MIVYISFVYRGTSNNSEANGEKAQNAGLPTIWAQIAWGVSVGHGWGICSRGVVKSI